MLSIWFRRSQNQGKTMSFDSIFFSYNSIHPRRWGKLLFSLPSLHFYLKGNKALENSTCHPIRQSNHKLIPIEPQFVHNHALETSWQNILSNMLKAIQCTYFTCGRWAGLQIFQPFHSPFHIDQLSNTKIIRRKGNETNSYIWIEYRLLQSNGNLK